MKKILFVSLIALITTSLSGCGYRSCCSNPYNEPNISTYGCCGSSSW
ncbi:hypothetical protein [Legionella rubrilucens]|nr:hypothetical protein [Legionella rubrilucens]